VVAIVWIMTVKPGTADAIGVVVACYAVCVVAALFARA